MRHKLPRLVRRNHIFYIRVGIPKKIKKLVKVKEIRYSLGTADFYDALVKCREESYKIDTWFKELLMKIREDNSLELNQNDLDAIKFARLEEIENQRKKLLKTKKEIPTNEFGLFSKDNFKKWVEEDPAYPERKLETETTYEKTEDGEWEEKPALTLDSNEFKVCMILEWLKGYLGNILKSDFTLDEITRKSIKGILTDNVKLQLFYNKQKTGAALTELKGCIYPLEKYANEKAVAEYQHLPYEPDSDIQNILEAIKLKRINEIANARVGKKVEMTHWKSVWERMKQDDINANIAEGTIETKYTRLKKIFEHLDKEYLEAITVEDCDKLTKDIYTLKWGRENKCMTVRTASSYLGVFKTLMKLGRSRDNFNKDNNLRIIDVSELIKIQSKEKQMENAVKRRLFEESDLELIFDNEKFISYRYDMEYFPRFWLPLICLYSGARLNEIAQIEIDDIKEIEEIEDSYFISINKTGKDKTVKNKQSCRLVSIHHKLIELGFLDLVKKVSESRRYITKWCAEDSKKPRHTRKGKVYYPIHNTNHIFFPLTLTKKNGYGKKVSGWFNPLIKKLGIKYKKNALDNAVEKLVFHSARHQAATALYENGFPDIQIDKTMGWKGTGIRHNYIKDVLPKIKEAIESITYPEFEKNVLPHLMPDLEKEKDFFNFK